MKERLIPYAPDMVRAKRAGLKSQTRRIAPVSELDIHSHGNGMVSWRVKFSKPIRGVLASHSGGKFSEEQARSIIASQFCPYGKPGDILLTREAWRTRPVYDSRAPRDIRESAPIWYEADGPAPDLYNGRYRHARFMCRWMCRDRDEITAVRIERLQDISEEDAIAEGIRTMTGPRGHRFENAFHPDDYSNAWEFPSNAYRALWEKINGRDSWDLNPWVWVVSFRRIES